MVGELIGLEVVGIILGCLGCIDDSDSIRFVF